MGLRKRIVGNATQNDVRQGIIFSSGSGSGQVGTVPTNNGIVIVPGTTQVPIPVGIYDGSAGAGKINAYPDLIASNIKVGKVIGAVTGTAYVPQAQSGTDMVIQTISNGAGNTSLSPIKTKELLIKVPGTYTVDIALWTDNGANYVNAQIYVNGSARGTGRSVNALSPTVYSEDITVNANDLIQIYAWTNNVVSNAYSRFDQVRTLKSVFAVLNL